MTLWYICHCITGEERKAAERLDRFMRFVSPEPMSGCWLWTGALIPAGYGVFGRHGERVGAHRAAHEFFLGPIPPGRHIDHLCRNRACVNPQHLEAVTQAENNRRGAAWYRPSVASCPNGHPYEGAKVAGREWRCRQCRSMRRRRYKLKRRAMQCSAGEAI